MIELTAFVSLGPEALALLVPVILGLLNLSSRLLK